MVATRLTLSLHVQINSIIVIQPLFRVMCFSLTIVLILLFHCNHWLIKEPVKQNAFKLVYNIINYAIKKQATEMQK